MHDKKFFVYLLLTERNTLYCGYTNDVKKRFQTHLSGKGAKYTRINKPVKIVWLQEFATKSDALKAELQIKKLPRTKKEELINSNKSFSF